MKIFKYLLLFSLSLSVMACSGDTAEGESSDSDSTEVVENAEECGPDCEKECCAKKKKCDEKGCCKKKAEQCCMDEECEGDCGMMHCCMDESCEGDCGKEHCCTDENCDKSCGKKHMNEKCEKKCEDGCEKECCKKDDSE